MSESRRAVVLDWTRGYKTDWLRPDVVAGLTAAAVVIPKAMAYATIAGLPVQVGLYTALVPMVIYAVLGTSRVLSVSTTTTIAILTAAELGHVAPNGDPATLLKATATLTLLVGAILVLASVLRLGFVANFISEPVLIGFKAGIGLVIVLDQLPKLLGVHIHKGGFFHNVGATIAAIPDTSRPTLAVGVGTLLLLLGVKRFLPRVPAPIVAVVAGIAAMSLLGLQALGVESIGKVPQGLPTFVSPDPGLFAVLWPGAMGIALMSFTETIASARAFAASGEPPLIPNRELLATGLANAGAGLLGCMPGGGGTSQTAVNRQAGARTQLSALTTAGATLLTMLFLAQPMGLMPQATLAAIVIVYSVGLISLEGFQSILAVRRTEFLWAVVALAGVLLLGTLQGILVAIIVSIVALGQQVASPPVYLLGRKPGTNVFRPTSAEHPEDETFPGLLIVRPEGRIFFLNAARIGERVQRLVDESHARVVVLDLSGVFDLEYSALVAFVEAEKRLRENGITAWLAGLNPGVLEVVQRSELARTLGHERMHFNLEIAVREYLRSQKEEPSDAAGRIAQGSAHAPGAGA
jgi:high affinity sulfate transporter 1